MNKSNETTGTVECYRCGAPEDNDMIHFNGLCECCNEDMNGGDKINSNPQ